MAPDSAPEPGDNPTADAGSEKAGSGPGADSPPAPDVPSLAEIRWRLEPPQLDVMRDTDVRLAASWPGVPEADFSCRWDPGDRTGPLDGCSVTHKFVGGLADRQVGLVVRYRDVDVFSETRTLPLERLPVQELPAESSMLPAPPEAELGLRVAVAALFEEPGPAGRATLLRMLEATSPSLVFVFFNYTPMSTPASDEFGRLLTQLNEGRTWTAVPVYCALPAGVGSLPTVSSSSILMHGEGNAPPFRMAFLAGPALFVMLDPREGNNSLDQEKWMLEQLEAGKVAAHRVVLSCRGLERFTAAETGELTPQFRYYEKLLRGDVSLLISSLHPVFYYGRYGRLPVLSAGSALGRPGRLLSASQDQRNFFGLIDLVRGKAPAVRALRPEQPTMVEGLASFPVKVGNYVRGQ
jgi:hypothetical protein